MQAKVAINKTLIITRNIGRQCSFTSNCTCSYSASQIEIPTGEVKEDELAYRNIEIPTGEVKEDELAYKKIEIPTEVKEDELAYRNIKIPTGEMKEDELAYRNIEIPTGEVKEDELAYRNIDNFLFGFGSNARVKKGKQSQLSKTHGREFKQTTANCGSLDQDIHSTNLL
jgi:hypothetical protein